MSNTIMFEVNPHGSLFTCVPSIRHKLLISQDVTPTNSFDFGAALESVFPLLEIIFDFLSYEDLRSVADVKKSWKIIANNTLHKRCSPNWIIGVKDSVSSRIHTSRNFEYHSISLFLFFYDYKQIKLNNYICLHDKDGISRITFVEYLSKEVVPHNVNFCMISPTRLVSFFDNKAMHENSKKNIFEGLSLPEILNIRINMFICNLKDKETAKTIISESVKPNECLKCLLMFCLSYPSQHYLESFLANLLNGQDPKSVALGGGVIKGMKCFIKESRPKVFYKNSFLCITFLQDKDKDAEFNSSSIVISGDELVSEEFEEQLILLKEKSVMRTQGVAFRFCCASKFENSTESVLFQKHFPGIPLLGIDVNGEIGWNSIDLQEKDAETDEKPKHKKKKSHLNVLHSWSTIIVLVTWGKKI